MTEKKIWWLVPDTLQLLPCKQTTVQILYFSDEGVHCARKFDNLRSLLVELVYSRTLPLFQQLMGHAAEPWLFWCSPVRISQKSLQAELAKQKTNFIGKNSSHKRCKYYVPVTSEQVPILKPGFHMIATIAKKKIKDRSHHMETTLQRSQRSQRSQWSQRQRSLG